MTIEAQLRMIQKIKQARQFKGLSQYQFYSETGIHIGRIEAMKRIPNIDTISKICKYLDLEVSEVVKQ